MAGKASLHKKESLNYLRNIKPQAKQLKRIISMATSGDIESSNHKILIILLK